MAVAQWVKDLTENVIGTEEGKVREPKQGQVVIFKPFHNSKDYRVGDSYLVEIINGQYWGTHGVSNFWHWYRLEENRNRIKEEHGYGNFYSL